MVIEVKKDKKPMSKKVKILLVVIVILFLFYCPRPWGLKTWPFGVEKITYHSHSIECAQSELELPKEENAEFMKRLWSIWGINSLLGWSGAEREYFVITYKSGRKVTTPITGFGTYHTFSSRVPLSSMFNDVEEFCIVPNKGYEKSS